MNHRIALFGTSLALTSIGAALATAPELELLAVEPPCDDPPARVDAFAPDVVIFDLAASLPDRSLRRLLERPDLALIGLDLKTEKMLLLSRESANLSTIDDLICAIKKVTAARHPLSKERHTLHSKRPTILHGLLLIVLFVAALAWGHQTPARAAETAVVRAAGGSLVSGTPGPAVVLPIEVVNMQGLGAATVLVDYDPASLKAIACQRNTLFDVGQSRLIL